MMRGESTLEMLRDGGTLQLVSGSLALAALLLDYGWAQPAYPSAWDPPEPGSWLRVLVSLTALAYVFASVPAAVIYWKYVEAGTLCRAVQLLIGLVLLALVILSNAAAVDYYVSPQWRGVQWDHAQAFIVASVAFAAVGYFFSFAFEEKEFLRRLRSALSRRLFPLSTHEEMLEEEERPLLRDEEIDDTGADQERQEEHGQDQVQLEEQEQERGEEQQRNEEERRQGNRESEGELSSTISIAAAFCRASHAPFIFGCSAYIMALAVCCTSLILSFYSFEPNSEPFAWLKDEKPGILVLNELVRSSFAVGEDLLLDIESEPSDARSSMLIVREKDDASNIVWQTVPGAAFLRIGYGELVSWAAHNTYYFADILEALSSIQTISRVLHNFEGSGGCGVRLLGNLEGATGVALPYSADIVGRCPGGIREEGLLSFDIRINVSYPRSLRVQSSRSRMYFIYSRGAGESFFGFGTQLSHVNFKQCVLPIVVRDKGFGRGLQPLTFLMNRFARETGGSWQHVHTAIPEYTTTFGRGFALHHSGLSVFDLSKRDRVSVEIAFSGGKHGADDVHASASFHAQRKDSKEKWIQRIHDSIALPEWAMHGTLIVDVGGGSTAVLKQLRALSSNGIAVKGITIRDWAGLIRTDFGDVPNLNWVVDENRYPNWLDFIGKVRQEFPSIKILLYFSPYLNPFPNNRLDESYRLRMTLEEDPLWTNASLMRENLDANTTFRKAADRNCLVIDPYTGGILMKSMDDSGSLLYGIVNLLEDRCKIWYASLIGEVASGFDGWVADHGEGYPFLPVGEVSIGGSEGHGIFVDQWLETSKAIRAREQLVISHTVTASSRRLAQLHMTGSQLTTWDSHDGLASALKGLLSSGLSGILVTSSYIGGVYSAIDAFGLIRFTRSHELIQRWLELASFTDIVLVTHRARSLTPNIQISHDAEVTNDIVADHVRKFVDVHRNLSTYKSELLSQAYESGLPLVRHMWLEFPSDPETVDLERQFMLGDRILVCPTLTQAASTVQCYIPRLEMSEEWQDFWSGEPLNESAHASTIKCKAPLGRPCVFKRVNN